MTGALICDSATPISSAATNASITENSHFIIRQ